MEERNTAGMSWFNLIAAVWLVSAPLIFHYTGTSSQINDMWTGFIIGVVSIIRLFSPVATRFLNWVNLFGGIWLIGSPFVLGYTNIAARWNDVLLGLVILAISLMNFGRSQSRHYRYRHFGRAV